MYCNNIININFCRVPIINGIPAQSYETMLNIDPVMAQKKGFDLGVHTPVTFYCAILNSLPKGCLVFSIMDIWDFNSTLIRSLSKEEIIDKINSVNISPTLGHPMNYSELLGGITRDEQNRITGAKVVKTQWVVYIDFTKIDMDEMDNDAGTADWVR